MSERGEAARRWLLDDALPLWSTAGVDPVGYGVWEALDHEGRPLRSMDKRFRVALRQSFVFAKAHTWFGAPTDALAGSLFDQACALAFARGAAGVPGLIGEGDEILTAPHDLYDIAFFILADAALGALGRPTDPRLKTALDALKTERGWREALEPRSGPRRQNPHMHLFEAATAQVAAGREVYRPVAEACFDLFRDVFFQPDGRVFEFFNEDWRPVSKGQQVEAGHIAEWVFLLETAGRVLGCDVETMSAALFARVSAMTNEDGLLLDVEDDPEAGRRFWPQIEFLKAAICREIAGDCSAAVADGAFDVICARYLDTPVAGGWFDKFDRDGALVSTNMPASTGYHVAPAMALYCAARTDMRLAEDILSAR